MEILTESTRSFEQDLDQLSADQKAAVFTTLNDCVDLFSIQSADAYQMLHQIPLFLDLNGYESSLYTLEVPQGLGVVLAVDPDPIFGRVIFTLFRVANCHTLDEVYRDVAKSLYQELPHRDREPAQIP